MDIVLYLLTLALYIFLMPDFIIPRMPERGSRFAVALVHGVIFIVLLQFIHSLLSNVQSNSYATTIAHNQELRQTKLLKHGRNMLDEVKYGAVYPM